MVCPVAMLVQSSQHGGLWLGLELFPEAWHAACLAYTGQALSSQMEDSGVLRSHCCPQFSRQHPYKTGTGN